eukprot:CAMPEP_0119259696 /NCGR_PEP_ID=MMETSP1329-20130426/414_1 /TAXON_ID=114041 /ORGANISM="Genus nov. species nov., Strain RCC1024" /LENGTH=123 /DNA_ID=CAMNT_0007259095 /DNA_START=27 /DNA_END=398 /DNA_ORIENTATION=+
MFDPGMYLKLACFVFTAYGLQMLVLPANMVTDHFDAPATPLLQFWIRGSSVAWLSLTYSMYFKMAESDAVPLATVVSFLVGVLYPWNAKIGYLSPQLPVKYPMHYVPEVLMLVLTVSGVAAMM